MWNVVASYRWLCSWKQMIWVTTMIADDSVYLVLWYKDGNPQPVYSYDARYLTNWLQNNKYIINMKIFFQRIHKQALVREPPVRFPRHLQDEHWTCSARPHQCGEVRLWGIRLQGGLQVSKGCSLLCSTFNVFFPFDRNGPSCLPEPSTASLYPGDLSSHICKETVHIVPFLALSHLLRNIVPLCSKLSQLFKNCGSCGQGFSNC